MKHFMSTIDFNKDIVDFTKFASSPDELIKIRYKELVKKYHPDVVDDSCIELANTFINKLNYVLYKLKTGNDIFIKDTDGFVFDEKRKRYKFINEYGVVEYIKELSLVLFKNGLLEINNARNLIHDNPRNNNQFESINIEAIRHVYKGIENLKRSLKTDNDSPWSDQVRIYIEYGSKLNARLASGISKGTVYSIVAL